MVSYSQVRAKPFAVVAAAFRFIIGSLICALVAPVVAGEKSSGPVPVELVRNDGGWQLLRNGEPYFIRGAGGDGPLAELAAAGANSIRVWDAEGIEDRLDEAHDHGLTVAVGIWLGHERHGFDYSNRAQVDEQLDRVRKLVLQHKDHPAVLLWSVGNEMEGFAAGDDARIWSAVNEAAALVTELDPHHPVMTVTSEAGGERIEFVHKRSPDIQIHGINSYGGARSLASRLTEGGASKPYIVTELGPPGPWEVAKTSWGAAIEPTSTEKAKAYEEHYVAAVAGNSSAALGAYAFLWAHKMETTPTWFGMYLPDGARLGAIDTMTRIWSGKAPDNLAPLIEPLGLDGRDQFEPGDEFTVAANGEDPEGEPLTYRWELRPDSDEFVTGGDFRRTPEAIPESILSTNGDSVTVRLPEYPGAYRLFAYIYDAAGAAATANVPILVKGEVRTRLPVAVYTEGFDGMPWAPSGWMGNTKELQVDGAYEAVTQSGEKAIRIRYEGVFGWAGVAWQHPANNWGERPGGHNVTGASALSLWARGEYGGEKVSFGVGLLADDVSYPDSGQHKLDDIVLGNEWQRYEVPLAGVDLSSLKTGFVVTLGGRRSPVTIYLDDIRFIP
ncbi:MAG: glycoside hydrolase family 2 TIM barrel-domain containing protein [Pseudomonadota bacterium]